METLKNYVNWKLAHSDKVADAEGYPLVMENCKTNKRMKQLQVYGDCMQRLGSKNLLPYPYYKTTATINGVTFTDNGDGSIIPCVYIKSKTPARYTIVYSHANAEDLGYL